MSISNVLIRKKTIAEFSFSFDSNPMPDSEPMLFKTKANDHFHYFDITNEGIIKKLDPFKERFEFWDEIYGINETWPIF